MINRRTFLYGLTLGALIAPLAAEAQAGKVWRVEVLANTTLDSSFDGFREGLRNLGYLEGRNLVIEARYADAKLDRLPALAAELVGLKVDLILTIGTPAARAAKQVTTTIPIVFTVAADPVEQRLVASFARPGGNLTGFALGDYGDKQLELLKEAVPRLSHVACLCGGDPVSWSSLSDAAGKLGLRLQLIDVRDPTDLDGAVTVAASGPAGGLLVPNTQWIGNQLQRIGDLTAKRKLAAVGFHRVFVDAGGLLSYGPTQTENAPRLAAQMDRIFKDAKPADLPVEQPTKFEVVINLKTAKALGVTIPPVVLSRADEVIR